MCCIDQGVGKKDLYLIELEVLCHWREICNTIKIKNTSLTQQDHVYKAIHYGNLNDH